MGVVAIGVTVVGALSACSFLWFSSRAKLLKDEMASAEETATTVATEAISHLERSSDWVGRAAIVFTVAGAVIGCLSWWFSFLVNDTKYKSRMLLEAEYAAKLTVAKSDVITAREETAKALADMAVANARVRKLEVEAVGLRERAARAKDLAKVAEAQSEKARKEATRARNSTTKALADMAVANARVRKLEVEVAGFQEPAARTETESMEAKVRIERRAISNAQRTRLLKDLKAIQKEPIQIIAVLGDEEAGTFAKAMAGVLREAGWSDVHVRRGVFSGGTEGFEIRLRNREKVPGFALQIARAFDSIGFEPSFVLDPSVAEGAIELIIGMNPDSG